jgi:hypothetical protein
VRDLGPERARGGERGGGRGVEGLRKGERGREIPEKYAGDY